MFRRSIGILTIAVLALVTGVQAQSSFSETLGEYNGDAFASDADYPLSPVSIGTFATPTSVAAATIFGTFGNSTIPNSAGVDLFLDGIMVGQCVKDDPCWTGASPTPWSYTFGAGEFGIFSDGMAELTAVQTSEFVIRLGETTLEGRTGTTTVPEPTSLAIFATGLLGLGFLSRPRKDLDLEERDA